MNILAIETSCDETSVAILRDGRHVLANIVASQIDLHKQWGGVVPELASRQHIVNIVPVLQEAFRQAELGWPDIDAIAVTSGPGLAGALLVGLNAAKALAFAHNKPLIAVNHLEGHIYSNWVVPEGLSKSGQQANISAKNAAKPRRAMPDHQASESTDPRFPLLGLIVSGGHTELVYMAGHGQYTLLGKTVDDAAGEAFDKVARILGLPYPGGPEIQKAAENGDPNAIELPRKVMRGSYDFSFSGLKTAVLHKVQEYGPALGPADQRQAEIIAGAEQQQAEQPGRLDRNQRKRHPFSASATPYTAPDAEPFDLPGADSIPAPAVAQSEIALPSAPEPANTIPVQETAAELAEEPIRITNWQTSGRPQAQPDQAGATPEPVPDDKAETNSSGAENPLSDETSWTESVARIQEDQIIAPDETFQPTTAAPTNSEQSGLIRLRPVPEGGTNTPLHRAFEFRNEPEAPLAGKETPGEPRVLGREEGPAVDLPPFLATRSGSETPAEPSTAPTDPTEAEIPGFLRQRSRAEQRAQQHPVVAPPLSAAPRRYDIPDPNVESGASVDQPESEQKAPAPQTGKTPTSRLRSLRQAVSADSSVQIKPVQSQPETQEPVSAAPTEQAQTNQAMPPAVETPPTMNWTQKGPERNSAREIRSIPKAVQAGRAKPAPEDEDFDRLLDDALDPNAASPPQQPKRWSSWIDAEEPDDDPGPGKGGTVALEGPRRPEASVRVGGKDKDNTNKPPLPVADVAAAFQASVAEILSEKVASAAAAYEVHIVLLAGGVAANTALRARLQERLGGQVELRFPPAALCTDNAAMIAAAAYFRFESGLQNNWALDIDPNASYIRD